MKTFEQTVLVHLDAAYNLARWIVRDDTGAEDVVQEASLRAHRFLAARSVEHPKSWFMTVVRNACLDWLREHRRGSRDESYDDELHGLNRPAERDSGSDPEQDAIRAAEARWLRECIERLPIEYREVIVLRELEELSYREISSIVDVPIGTVMSRLARARDALLRSMHAERERMKR